MTTKESSNPLRRAFWHVVSEQDHAQSVDSKQQRKPLLDHTSLYHLIGAQPVKRKTKKGKTVVKPGSKGASHHKLVSAIRSALLGRPEAFRWFPLPVQLKATLRYSTLFSVNPGAGTCGVQVFSANGLYDPDITSAGHQPSGFDELITLYDHGVVTHSSIEVHFNPGTIICVFGVNPISSAAAAYSDLNGFREQAHCKWDLANSYITSGGLKEIILHNKMDVAKFLGVRDLLDGREYASDNAANPSEGVFWQVWAAANDGASDPGAMNGQAVITYEVIFVEPRAFTGS